MKTKNNIFRILSGLIFVLMATLNSCNTDEFLEYDQPPEQAWKNVKDFEMAVVYPYNRAFLPGWGGGFTDNYDVLTEGLSDVLYLMDNAGESYPHDEVYYRQTDVSIARASGAFGYCYDAINNIVAALSFVNDPSSWTSAGQAHPFENLTDAEKDNLDRQVGELYFMKAFSYYNLVFNHAPPPGSDAFSTAKVLPYRNSWNIDPEVQSFPEYATAKKIYDSVILPDLKKAIELLPWQPRVEDHQSYGYGRANKYTAIGLASRVFMSLAAENNSYWGRIVDLFEGNDPITAGVTNFNALDVSAGVWGVYNLSDPFSEAYVHNDDEFVSDAIWSALYYDVNIGGTPKEKTLLTWNKYSAIQADPYNRDTSELKSNRCSWHVFSLANTVAEKLDWIAYDDDGDSVFSFNSGNPELYNDIRYFDAFVVTRKDDPSIPAPIKLADKVSIWETRYPTEDRSYNIWIHKYFRGPVGNYTNIPIMKLSEMMLNYAVAAYETSQLAKATSAINKIRTTRGLAALAGDAAFLDIDREYIKELVGEGHRLRFLLALKGDEYGGNVIPEGDKRYVNQTVVREDPKAGDAAYKIRRAAVSWTQVKNGDPNSPNQPNANGSGSVKLYWPIPIDELIFKQ